MSAAARDEVGGGPSRAPRGHQDPPGPALFEPAGGAQAHCAATGARMPACCARAACPWRRAWRQDNVNPVDGVERSSLILASTVHAVPPAELVCPEHAAAARLRAPALFAPAALDGP